MTRVSLAHTAPSYAGLAPPFGPGRRYPELVSLLGEELPTEAPNGVYAGVRAALLGLGLDADHFGDPSWNPIGALVSRGGRVVLKPNFIRHWNPNPKASVESVVTHGAVLRAVADYAWLALGAQGSVVIAEAPQQDCSFAEMDRVAGLSELVRYYAEAQERRLEVIDLRREEVDTLDGVIVSRRPLPGDPAGYRAIDLGTRSFFQHADLDPERLRGADYDPAPTALHHMRGRNEYLLSETVLRADLIVNLPKLKTHKKTGVTLALKNLVGVNGDKNWLPHHCLGSVAEGGDEFPGAGRLDRWRSRGTEVARRSLKRGAGVPLFRALRRLERAVRGDEFIRSGNWHGNRTTWRMVLDLNRCLYYSDAKGLYLDAERPVRRILTLLDGIVAGEGAGPLAPRNVPLGVVLASMDPVALDLTAIRLMGFDEEKIPKVWEAMRDRGPRVTQVRDSREVVVVEVDAKSFASRPRPLHELEVLHPFAPHSGWSGHIERDPR
ncbi:MAG: DUF362 domain-containing protein [Myxococcota bacterium]